MPWVATVMAAAALARTPPGLAELAQRARAVFEVKCVQCHGPALPHPRGHFGFVTDLDRLVQSGTYIVPGDPGKSDVWQEIAGGDMPPDGAKAGPLSDEQKETIRLWIVALGSAAGAAQGPAGDDPARAAPQAVAPALEAAEPDPAPRGRLTSGLVLLGRMHVVVVHFPIALLVVAAMQEAAAALTGGRLRGASAASVRIGALSAVAAAALGWLHAATDGYAPWPSDPLAITGLHRWLGTAAAALSLPLLWMSRRGAQRGTGWDRATILLVGVACLVGAAGHFGGLLVHGADFLSP